MDDLDVSMDVNPFQFQKKSFASKRKEKHYSSSSDDDEEEDECKRMHKQKYSLNIDSDSDSDIESYRIGIAKKEMPTQQKTCIDILDSSDDDDGDDDDDSVVEISDAIVKSRKIVTNCDALKKAHEAREKLKKAQKTFFVDAIDIDSDENNENFAKANSTDSTQNSNEILRPQVNVNSNINMEMGPLLKINVRTSTNEQQSFKIRSKEPFQNLMISFLNRHSLTLTSNAFKIYFKVDGETVPLTNTPNFYDLEDEDQIEVLLKNNQGKHITIQEATKLSNALATETNHASSSKNSSMSDDQVVIKTFIHPPISSVSSSNEDLWQIRSTDPFHKLVTAVGNKRKIEKIHSITLQYEDKNLDWNCTPNSAGMKSGNTMANPITLLVRLSPNDVAHMKSNNLNDTIQGKKLKFKLRVNGNDKDIQEFSMGEKNNFEFLIQQFCNKNNTDDKKVKFILDGDTINPKATPMSEDLEGGEIIDVVIKACNNTLNNTNQMDFNDEPLTVQTIRNKTRYRPKRFKLLKSDTINRLKNEYIAYYKAKGCRTVKFYYRDKIIGEGNYLSTFASLGIKDMDTIHAIENGMKF